jgi:hypothetical protein
MGLVYQLSKTDTEEQMQQLKIELAPRNSCRTYAAENGGEAELVRKIEFDAYCKKKSFVDGPHRDGFGDGAGEPYNPHRQAFGKSKSGLVIYCELSEEYQEKTEELFRHLGI